MDKNISVMTMIFKESPPGHKTRCEDDDIIVAMDSKSKRILHYQRAQALKRLHFPMVRHLEVLWSIGDLSVCQFHKPISYWWRVAGGYLLQYIVRVKITDFFFYAKNH